MSTIANLMYWVVVTTCLAFIALFLYAAYGQPELIDAVYCRASTDNDPSYMACRNMNN